MSDVLCIYYSRTGNTRKAMEEVAEALGAELVQLHDTVSRRSALRCGLDAMRRTVRPVRKFHTERPLADYRLVIVGSPIWAGRCSSVTRSFLKEYGKDLRNVAFLVTRGTENKNEEVYEQMDQYVPEGHRAAGSLRTGSVGYTFWQEEFLRQVQDFLGTEA